MQLRTERAVFLFTLFLMIGAFAVGQSGDISNITGFATSDFNSPITGQATQEAWNFEGANELGDYIDVVWNSLGEKAMDMIMAFGIVFAIFVIGLGLVGDIAKNDQASKAMNVFAVFASLGTAYYVNVNNVPFSTFIGEYSLIITILLLALILGKIAMALKSDKSSWGPPLIAGGLGFMLIGSSMIYVLADSYGGWGWILLVAGVMFVFAGAFALLMSANDEDKKSWSQQFADTLSGKNADGSKKDSAEVQKEAADALELFTKAIAENAAAIKINSGNIMKILADLTALINKPPAVQDNSEIYEEVNRIVGAGTGILAQEIAEIKHALAQLHAALQQQQNMAGHTLPKDINVTIQKTAEENVQLIRIGEEILRLLGTFHDKLMTAPQAYPTGNLDAVVAELKTIGDRITALEKREMSVSQNVIVDLRGVVGREQQHQEVEEEQQHEQHDKVQHVEDQYRAVIDANLHNILRALLLIDEAFLKKMEAIRIIVNQLEHNKKNKYGKNLSKFMEDKHTSNINKKISKYYLTPGQPGSKSINPDSDIYNRLLRTFYMEFKNLAHYVQNVREKLESPISSQKDFVEKVKIIKYIMVETKKHRKEFVATVKKFTWMWDEHGEFKSLKAGKSGHAKNIYAYFDELKIYESAILEAEVKRKNFEKSIPPI
jgi:hypothetical protein